MRSILTASLLFVVSACASAPRNNSAPASSIPLADALRTELLRGEAIDLNTDLAAGRPIALVFWQAW